ncbi:unnamed protein product [Lactuca saligna]|uniref:Uncharacterized protein n=1 Tax=Lactuca saligna TaxID=75948 RepID=A0AA35Y6Q1_LACSI|nr:unnamed protein product [Lactuca saligna]
MTVEVEFLLSREQFKVSKSEKDDARKAIGRYNMIVALLFACLVFCVLKLWVLNGVGLKTRHLPLLPNPNLNYSWPSRYPSISSTTVIRESIVAPPFLLIFDQSRPLSTTILGQCICRRSELSFSTAISHATGDDKVSKRASFRCRSAANEAVNCKDRCILLLLLLLILLLVLLRCHRSAATACAIQCCFGHRFPPQEAVVFVFHVGMGVSARVWMRISDYIGVCVCLVD